MADLTTISKGKWIVDDCGVIAEVMDEVFPVERKDEGIGFPPGATLEVATDGRWSAVVIADRPWLAAKRDDVRYFNLRVTRPALAKADFDHRRHAVAEIHDSPPDHRQPLTRPRRRAK
jgi:hypothetical protein